MPKKSYRQVVKEYPELAHNAKRRNTRKQPTPAQIAKRREIVDFAREYGLTIHPGGYDYYIESFFMFGCCPCDPSRLNCPCPEAVDEVEKNGWCKCRLFWRDLLTFRESHLLNKEEK